MGRRYARHSPEQLHGIIDTTPVWTPVLQALRHLVPGGRLVVNAIRKESVDQFTLADLDYPTHLWMEKEFKSVANVARRDIRDFLRLASEIPIRPQIQEFALADANRALLELKNQTIRGAKVLRVEYERNADHSPSAGRPADISSTDWEMHSWQAKAP